MAPLASPERLPAPSRRDPPVLLRMNALAQVRAGRKTRRIIQLLTGLVGYGASVMMLVQSGLGAASWSVLTEGTSHALGISFGWATNLISLLVLLAWIPLRELPGLGTLLNTAIIGFAADATAAVLPEPHGMLCRSGYLLLGLTALAFFDALYLGAQFGSGPRDGIMTGLVRLTRLPVAAVRTGIDVVVAAAGWLLGGTAGVGTVFVAVCMGPLVGFFLPRVAVRLTAAAGASPTPTCGSSSSGRRDGSARGANARAESSGTLAGGASGGPRPPRPRRTRTHMFRGIGRAVVRHPIWTIVVWIIAAAAVVLTAPALPSNSDESSFLPKSYESIKAMDLQQKAFPQAFTPAAIVLYERTDGAPMTGADKAAAQKITAGLTAKKIDEVTKVVPGAPSKDGRYDMALVQMTKSSNGQPEQADAAKALRTDASKLAGGTHLTVRVGGSAAQNLDQQDSAKRGEALIGIGTFVIILVALLAIFRSPIIAVLPLILIGVVSQIANGLIADATKLFGLQANSSVSSILIVVLFGVGTDYILFLLFRYRERLRAGDESKEAMVNAVGRVGEAIASAAGAVIIAFLALILSTLGFLKQMGPALAIAVAVTLLAGLTLVPAVVSLIGPKVFWPSKTWKKEPDNAAFAALGRGIKRRPAIAAVVSGLVMVALALGTTGFKATFDLASGSMPKTKESMVVQDKLQQGYSAGAADPTHVYVTSTDGKPLALPQVKAYAGELQQVPGVATAAVAPTAVSKDGKTVDVTVVLKDSAASGAAMNTVGTLRDTAHAKAPDGSKALVGGTTAVYKDIDTAVNHDYRTVFPVAAVLIMVILGLLLRSVVAPWYLMASVGLGFGATLGATVLLFQKAQGHDGLMFMLPVIMYLFVVAIGTDYNILMIARLREEAREGRTPREAASMAVRHAGPTVAAAGVILAATFATMMLAGNSLLTEMGFAVAFGIVVAAFVMALFFTPSLTALIGHAAWWPGHADRSKAVERGESEADGSLTGHRQ